MKATTIYGIQSRNINAGDFSALMEFVTFEKLSTFTLKEIFIHFYSRKRKELQNEMLSHQCSWLSWDHTFWTARLIHMNQRSPFTGYFIVMNQVKNIINYD